MRRSVKGRNETSDGRCVTHAHKTRPVNIHNYFWSISDYDIKGPEKRPHWLNVLAHSCGFHREICCFGMHMSHLLTHTSHSVNRASICLSRIYFLHFFVFFFTDSTPFLPLRPLELETFRGRISRSKAHFGCPLQRWQIELDGLDFWPTLLSLNEGEMSLLT